MQILSYLRILENFIKRETIKLFMAAIKGPKDFVTSTAGLLLYHDGEFNVDDFYENAKEWFRKRKYDYTEIDHIIKNKRQGREIVYIFKGERKIDNYFQFTIQSRMLATRVRELKNGNYEGLVKINVKAWIDLDWNKNWQGTPFTKFLFYVYNNFIIKNKIQRLYETKLYLELLDYVHVIKEVLKYND